MLKAVSWLTGPTIELFSMSTEAFQMLLAWLICVPASKLISQECCSSAWKDSRDLTDPGLLCAVVGRLDCLSSGSAWMMG